MRVELHQSPGSRNDLLVVFDRSELKEARLSIANRKRFSELPGLIRHRPLTKDDEAEKAENGKLKKDVTEHLKGLKYLTERGEATCRAIAIGNRNLGNNQGFMAWQAGETEPLFRIRHDRLPIPTYSCLVLDNSETLSIRNLAVTNKTVLESGQSVAERIQWASYGQHVLRSGRVVDVEEVIGEIYDIRHVLAYDRTQVNPARATQDKWYYKNVYPDGKAIEEAIYADYENDPSAFRAQAMDALRKGVPRARYLQNAVGLSSKSVFILQREGTLEEVGRWLADAGAEDGLIFDNGGSVFTWAWFVNAFAGGFLFSAPDFRSPSSAIVVFVLKGPVRANLPSGSISPAVI